MTALLLTVVLTGGQRTEGGCAGYVRHSLGLRGGSSSARNDGTSTERGMTWSECQWRRLNVIVLLIS